MDLYMPAREDRRSWTAVDDVMITAMVTSRTPELAYLPGGSEVLLDTSRPRSAYPALLLVQYREAKDIRVNRQLDTPGMVIQDPDDGEIGGLVPWRTAGGRVMMRQLAEVVAEREAAGEIMNAQCTEETCGGGGGGGGGGQSYTYLTRLETVHVCDGDPFCTSNNEFEFRATASNGFRYPEWPRLEGVQPDTVRDLNLVVNLYSPLNVNYLEIPVVETDNLTDDNYKIAEQFDEEENPLWFDIVLDGNDFGRVWNLWKQGGDWQDYPDKNTVRVTFTWTG